MSQLEEKKEKSQVLAIKYRPKSFEALIGQEAVSQTLSLALDKKRLSHAYLFSGLRGSGKTSSARIFSKSLLCDNGPTSTPCEICQNCIMSNDGRHIDIIELDGASNRKIDDVRDLIEQSKYKPSIGRFKIFIIDEVHMLTKEAFNALLKTLEEPPLYIKFILATTDPLKLPTTILSRTQHFKFKKISQKNVINHLINILNKEHIDFEDSALEILARSGDGSLRDTLTLLDQSILFCKSHITASQVSIMLGLIDPNIVESIFENIINNKIENFNDTVTELIEYDIESVLDGFVIYLKNEMLKGSNKFSPIYYERFFRILSDAKSLLIINSDLEFVLILTLMKLKEAINIEDIDDVIAKLENNIDMNSINNTSTKKQEKVEKPTIEESHKFDILIDKLAKNNLEVADCFKKGIKFISYEDNILSWESNSSTQCREVLKKNYSIIKNEVQTLFGIDTKIALINSKKELSTKRPINNNSSDTKPIEKKKSFKDSNFVQTAIKSFKAKQVIVTK